MADPMTMLEAALTEHGLTVQRNGDWFAIKDAPEQVRARYTREVDREGGMSIQLEVDTRLADGRVINECLAGWGQNREIAEVDARENFWTSSLHVLLAAFWKKTCNGQVDEETWRIGGKPWRVALGPYRLRGPNNKALYPPPSMIEPLQQLISAKQLSGDTHWCRAYCAMSPTEAAPAVECLWDNARWPEGEQALQRIQWPKLDAFYSVRHFMVLRRG